MAARRPRPQPPPGGLLDWGDSSHWSSIRKPCRFCGRPTNLRDDHGKACEKTCAEAALAQQAADTGAAYQQNGTL